MTDSNTTIGDGMGGDIIEGCDDRGRGEGISNSDDEIKSAMMLEVRIIVCPDESCVLPVTTTTTATTNDNNRGGKKPWGAWQ